jgi:short-subunit dehydrogenase
MPADLNGARVLLTGATGGIGNAIARALHARGAHVAVTGRRKEMLDDLASELGDRIEALTADLAAADEVRTLAERAGKVDVFVSNAALPASGALDDFSAEHIDRALDVNLRAPMQLTRTFLPAMCERGTGHVVLVSSMSGKISSGYGTVYSASKFGLRGFGLGLNDELHGTGVGATVISPGFIRDAGMFADADVKLPPGVGTRTPDQVAAVVVRAIEKGGTDMDVAPLPFRLSGRLYGIAPGAFHAAQRVLGSRKVAQALAEGQADKR